MAAFPLLEAGVKVIVRAEEALPNPVGAIPLHVSAEGIEIDHLSHVDAAAIGHLYIPPGPDVDLEELKHAVALVILEFSGKDPSESSDSQEAAHGVYGRRDARQ